MNPDEMNDKLHGENALPEMISFEPKIVDGLNSVTQTCLECPMLAVLISEMYAHPRSFVN